MFYSEVNVMMMIMMLMMAMMTIDDVVVVVVSIADFVLLMCASQQWKVFENEQIEEWMVAAGENTDNPEPMEDRLFNPAPNFINCR